MAFTGKNLTREEMEELIEGVRKMKTCNTCRYAHRKGYYRVWGIKEFFSDLFICLKCRLIKSQWKNKW